MVLFCGETEFGGLGAVLRQYNATDRDHAGHKETTDQPGEAALDARPQFALFYTKLTSAGSPDPATSLILASTPGLAPPGRLTGIECKKQDLTPKPLRNYSLRDTSQGSARICLFAHASGEGIPPEIPCNAKRRHA